MRVSENTLLLGFSMNSGNRILGIGASSFSSSYLTGSRGARCCYRLLPRSDLRFTSKKAASVIASAELKRCERFR